MKISVIAVGKLRSKSVSELAAEYAARLPAGLKLEWVEVKAEQGGADPASAKAREAERIRGRLPERAYVLALSERGRELSSREFARFLGSLRDQGRDLALLIGGADGLDPGLLQSADDVIALSRLTFPHELVRAILAEQIYRAFSILRGEPYHRD